MEPLEAQLQVHNISNKTYNLTSGKQTNPRETILRYRYLETTN